MISSDVAFALNASGLAWRPTAGDRFLIHRDDFESEVFTVSDMTIEAHEYSTCTILGFNGTTEWALDSVAQDDALWMPREDQLRDLLGGTFRALEGPADGRDGFRVTTTPVDGESTFEALTAADAYGLAVLALVRHALLDVDA
jgi:hypothetical protein